MDHRAIADNWTLQEVAGLLTNGLEPEVRTLVEIDKTQNTHRFRNVPSGVIVLEALFDFIADIVLREKIWVDDHFTSSWMEKSASLDALLQAQVVLPFRFAGQPQELVEPRRHYLRRLCATPSLAQLQVENEQGWSQSRQTPHRYLSQVVWGGAGMLARATVYDQPYTPHPVRKRLMLASGLALGTQDVVPDVVQLIEDKQAALRTRKMDGVHLTSLRVALPALASQAIRNSKQPNDLLAAALQLRQEYAELRCWLTEYQEALREGESHAIRKCDALLRSVSKYVESKVGGKTSDSVTFTVGLDWLKIAVKGDPVNAAMNRVGVRAQINKLVFSPATRSDLQHLLGIFGQRTSAVGLEITEHFSRTS